MKKKKTVVVQHRLHPNADVNKFWFPLYRKGWSKWQAYYDVKGASEAIERQSKKFTWLEFRIKPDS